MKSKNFLFKKIGEETDIEDSITAHLPSKTKYKRKRVPKYLRELKRISSFANYYVFFQ
jgi:hypothetical protein